MKILGFWDSGWAGASLHVYLCLGCKPDRRQNMAWTLLALADQIMSEGSKL